MPLDLETCVRIALAKAVSRHFVYVGTKTESLLMGRQRIDCSRHSPAGEMFVGICKEFCVEDVDGLARRIFKQWDRPKGNQGEPDMVQRK